jgi:hypothetical protein
MLQFMRAIAVSFASLLVFSLWIANANAQVCTSNGECANTQVCDKAFFGIIGSCQFIRCNSDADCSVTARPTICVLGMCQANCQSNANCPSGQACRSVTGRRICIVQSTPSPGSGTGTGTPLAGEGQACGPRQFGGGVIKSVGCAHGLLCQNQRCVRPAQ